MARVGPQGTGKKIYIYIDHCMQHWHNPKIAHLELKSRMS